MREDSSFFRACFSLLAKALDSLHGVKPAMSAVAGGGEKVEEERRMEERARAAENVFKDESCCWF